MANEPRKLIRESKRHRIKGRGKGAPFIRVEREWLDSPEFGDLSAHATKLFLDLARQYRGSNNGDFQAAWSCMRARGWNSSHTLAKALRELCERGWAVLTRQGGRHKCSLYALTVWPIDECGGKHDEAPTRVPLHLWREPSRKASGKSSGNDHANA